MPEIWVIRHGTWGVAASPAWLSSGGYRTLLGLSAVRWQTATGLLARVT